MSDGYLQRLFDRVGVYRPQVSQIVPSGASTSPLAMADQRLNDPGFADDFSFGSTGMAGMNEDTTTSDLYPQPLVTPSPISGKAPPPATPEPAEPQLKLGDVNPGRAAPPSAPIDQTPDFSIPRVGKVFESDLVHPETEESPLEPNPPATDTPLQRIEPVENPPESLTPVDEMVPTQEPTIAYTGSDPGVLDERPAQIFPPDLYQPSQAPERFESESADMDLTEPVTAESTAEPLQAEPAVARPVRADEPPQAVEAYPPPITPEPLPAITEAPALAPEPSVSAPTTPVVKSEVESEPVPTPPQQIRPMTASEASVIGPLEHRPRAVTLLGLRRR